MVNVEAYAAAHCRMANTVVRVVFALSLDTCVAHGIGLIAYHSVPECNEHLYMNIHPNVFYSRRQSGAINLNIDFLVRCC